MASGVELATAYVSIVPSTRGIKNQLQREVGDPLEETTARAGDRGGQSFGRNLASNAMASMDRLGDSIVGSVQRWAGRAAMVGGGIIGAGLFGGLNRVLDTEDATVAFQQMGLSVREIDKAMKGVDRTFDGTPFANPDGFNISAQLLASGRELGQVESDLLNIANVTSQTLDKDLNRTSETFLRIAATGRVFASDLNLLAMQGIPMRNILADGLDVTVDALNGMVSAGDVTFDTLMDVIDGTERFDGAAQAMGNTTRGAFQNVLTGVSRLGESFLGPLFGEGGHAVTALQGIRNVMRDLTPAADDLGRRFAAWLIPALQSASDWFQSRLVPAVRSAAEWFAEHRDQISRVVRALIPAAAGIAGIAVAMNLVRRVLALTPIGMVFALATALVYAYQHSEAFRDIVDSAFRVIRAVLEPLVSIVGTALVRVFSDLADLGGFVERNWGLIGPIFKTIAVVIGTLLIPLWVRLGVQAAVSGARNVAAWVTGQAAALRSAAVQVAQSARVVASWALMAGRATASAAVTAAAWTTGIIAPAGRAVAVMATTAARVVASWALMAAQSMLHAGRIAAAWLIAMGPIGIVIAAVVALVAVIVANFDTIKEIIAGAWEWIKNAAGAVWDWITDRISGFIDFFASIPDRIGGAFGDGFAFLRNLVSSARDWVAGRIGDIVGFFAGIPGRIRSVFGDGFAFLRIQVSNAVNWVRGRVDDVVGFIAGLPGRLHAVGHGIWSWIGDAFRNAINGLIRGWNSLSFDLPSFGGFTVMGRTVIPAWEGPTLGVPPIPYLHSGGVVPGRRGEDVLAILAAGETVLPTHDPSWSPSASAGIDGGDIVVKIGDSELVRIIREANRKRGGNLLPGAV